MARTKRDPRWETLPLRYVKVFQGSTKKPSTGRAAIVADAEAEAEAVAFRSHGYLARLFYMCISVDNIDIRVVVLVVRRKTP